MDQPGNGGDLRVERATDGDGTRPMPAQFGALYQAGFESGFASGKEAGYRQGYEAGYTQGRGAAAIAAPASGSAPRRPRQSLLGLPCANCGCFFYSDETLCPRCRKNRE